MENIDIEFYKIILCLKRIMFSDKNNIIYNLKNDEEGLVSYVNEFVLSILLGIICTNNMSNIITKKVKYNLYEYLSIFREYNKKVLKDENINNLINNCICELNKINEFKEEQFYYEQYVIRRNLKWEKNCYIKDSYKLYIDNLIASDVVIFLKLTEGILTEKQINELINENFGLLNINMLVAECESLLNDRNFCLNVYNIIDIFKLYLKNKLISKEYNGLIKGTNIIQKKIKRKVIEN